MQPNDDHKYVRINKFALAVIAVLVLGAGFIGWRLGGHTTTSSSDRPTSSTQPASTPPVTTNQANVKSLVSYSLPDGWKEASCPSVPSTVYLVPAGASGIDCNANPSAPVKLYVDTGNTTDCNQLQNIQEVKKHTCISLYINGHKSLKSSTEYLASSSYKKAETINAYYIDTGKGVALLEYAYGSDNTYQAGFDQLANSVQTKH